MAAVSDGRTPAVQRLGTAVLLQGPAVIDAHYLIALGIRDVRRRDGIEPSPRLRFLLEQLAAARAELAGMAGSRHGDVVDEPDLPPSGSLDLITTKEAAVILGRSERTCQRLAPELGGHRTGPVWLFDRGAVEAHALNRKEPRA